MKSGLASSSSARKKESRPGSVYKAGHGRPPAFPRHFIKALKGKPVRVTVLGETLSVRTWKGVLLETCSLMKKRHDSDFAKVLRLGGSKNPWFSHDPKRLRRPERLSGTSIFVDTNWSALNIVRICQHILALFGEEPAVMVVTE